MSTCNGSRYGFQTVVNCDVGDLSGSYRSFIEATSFITFAIGVALNTGILTVSISMYPNIDTFDALLMNLTFGELLGSFGLSFMLFVELTASIAPVGDHGCQFLTWLDLTSVTVTVTTIVALFFEFYKVVYNSARPKTMRPYKLWALILLLWIIASIPGMPYMATAKMGTDGYCHIGRWSDDAEVLFICSMIFFQVLIPLALIVYFFVRSLLALRVDTMGGTILTDEANPGSEATLQRGILKRKFRMIGYMALVFYMILITVSIIELSLALNLNNIESNFIKRARVRELASLLMCLKTVFIPLLFVFNDKLVNRFKKICCLCRRDPDVYNSLRYDVYQQTVSEGQTEDYNDRSQEEEMALANEEFGETERDDVAILDSS